MLPLICGSLAGELMAQTPCPEVQVIASGLLGPAKIIQTPSGHFLVAETGPEEPNHGRVSIVDRLGHRRTLLEGLPSARTFVGDFNGTTGLFLRDRTLYVVNGQGDVTVPGPAQGTEKANPTPASPIFSSVLAVDFSEALEAGTEGFALTLSDHQALKSGATLTLTNRAGESTTIRLVVDFVDSLPEPRPTFADHARHSHPYGIVADSTHLYVVDAGFNNLRKVEIATGAAQTLVSFPPTPSPLTNGPPVIENVPTSIRWAGSQLVVTLLGGAPFLPGLSKVVRVHPQTGAVVSLIEGLTTAIDSAALAIDSLSGGLLALEHNLSFPRPGIGRLHSFPLPVGHAVLHSACLVTPSSMLIDRTADRLILSELSTGRLVWLPAPRPLPSGGYIYFSEFVGGRIGRANLDGTDKVTLVSGLSNPIGPALDIGRGQMYWGEASSATMGRANLDGTGETTFVSSPHGGYPALDLAAGRMFWCISSRGNLRSANLDGSAPEVLVTGLNDPHAPVLDAAGGQLYWPNFGSGDIQRINVDGTGHTTLIKGLAGPSLLTLDLAGRKIYWTAHGTGDIRRANLDGSAQEILIRGQNLPSGIALELTQGHIYWANAGSGDIRRANLDGTGQQVLLRGLAGPAFIALDLSVPPPLNVKAVANWDGTFTLQWDALVGRAYQIQSKADLTRADWTNLGTRLTATNSTMTALDSTSAGVQRFYRVLLLP